MAGYDLTIDTSQVQRLCERVAKAVDKGYTQALLQRTIWIVCNGRLPKDLKQGWGQVYAMRAGSISEGIRHPYMAGGGCVIPLSGFRGTFPKDFPIRSGRRRKKKHKSGKRRNYRIQHSKPVVVRPGTPIVVGVLKGQSVALPDKTPHQGDNPPFWSGSTVRTTGNAGYPRVPALAVAQYISPASKGYAPANQKIQLACERAINRAVHDIMWKMG